MLDILIAFTKDKLRMTVMFALFALLCFWAWLYLNDEGARLVGLLCSAVAVHQGYRCYREKADRNDSTT